MAKKKVVVHMFHTEDIVRSVLKGQKVSAECGYATVHTREELDATAELVENGKTRICSDCSTAANGIADGITLRPQRGWLDLLEREWLALDAEVAKTRTYRFTFPLAA